MAILGFVLGTTLSGCGAHPRATSESTVGPEAKRCPPADASLPPFTRRLGSLVEGRAAAVCSLSPSTGVMTPRALTFTRGWVQVAAVDGIRLPADINLEPDLPRGLQRMTSCSEDAAHRFDVQVDGRWYAGRGFACMINL